MSARSLLSLALLVVGCDDGVTVDPPPPPTCADVVLSVGASSLTRCDDGARFAWQHGEQVLLSESTVGLRIAGVDALGPSWPDVAWRVDGDTVTVRHAGRADLPDLTVEMTLRDDGLDLTLRFVADAPIVVDAMLAPTGGLRDSTHVLQSGALLPRADATSAEGFAVWLGDVDLAAWTARPGVVHADGRVTSAPLGTLAPGAEFALTTHWRVDDPTAALRAAQPESVALGLGWRTGAAHGAVVDTDALAAERDALLALAPDPWIVIDGLWAPAQGDWVPPEALITALAPARVGLFWPAALVCPDAPLHAAEPTWRRPAEGACGRLDLNLPDVRGAVARAALALLDAGVAGLWMDDPALAAALSPDAVQAYEAAAPRVHLDRVSGAPADDCAAAAVEGPFPRTEACVQAVTRLESVGAAPEVAPVDGAMALLARLDQPRLAPIPLTLSGAPGAARQRLALTALGGGPLLVADAPSTVSEAAAESLARVAAVDLHRLAPALDPTDWPPSVWRGADGWVIFNWTDAPRTVPVPDAWMGVSGLLDPTPAGAELTVAPHDVRVFVAD